MDSGDRDAGTPGRKDDARRRYSRGGAPEDDRQATHRKDDARRRSSRERARRRSRRIAVAALVAFALIAAAVAIIYKPDIAKESVQIEAGEDIPSAAAFLKNDGREIGYDSDMSVVDTRCPGEYAVKLRSGRHVYDAVLIVTDETPPVIVGAADITVPVGESVSYKEGVTVTDNASAEPVLDIDASAVKLREVGKYPVIYTAADASGNSSSVQIILTVRAKTPEELSREELDRLADAALARCIRDGMSDYERLWAIFCYISANISYVDDAESMDEVAEGINGFNKHRGSCFTYFASMKAMLERAGFETVNVVRDNSKKEGRHFWSLVKYQGQWYHIDATPRGPEDGRERLVFLLTDSQIVEMNAAYRNYWAYDTKNYPASGTVSPYKGEALPG